jgi:hypothetical protein
LRQALSALQQAVAAAVQNAAAAVAMKSQNSFETDTCID